MRRVGLESLLHTHLVAGYSMAALQTEGRVRDGSREGEGESEGGGQADKKGGGKKEAM